MSARIDHLVVLADSLEQGAAWCQTALGVAPEPGGRHPLFGTHNRLLAIGTPTFELAYLEIIAVDPQAPPLARTRWFDMDDERLLAEVRTQGPRLIHWVARVPDLALAVATLAAQGIERGEPLQASRMTDRGPLEWQIAVRPDGQRLFDGCLPTLIEWGAVHPAAAMPESGVRLQGLCLQHPQARRLHEALASVGLADVPTEEAAVARVQAELLTPRGRILI